MAKVKRLLEWATVVTTGRTFEKPEPGSLNERISGDYYAATYEPPSFKTRESLKSYLRSRNAVRFRRLQKDFDWAKSELAKIPRCNPEDARFLL